MIITHIQKKEGGQWEPYTGVCDWEKEEFTGLIDGSYAYRFDNGDIWDKVGGWRDPMGWPSDPIFGFLDANRQKAIHGVVAHYEPPNYEPWQGIRGTTTSYYQPVNQSLFIDDYEEYKFEFTSNKKENLCSRHLWQ